MENQTQGNPTSEAVVTAPMEWPDDDDFEETDFEEIDEEEIDEEEEAVHPDDAEFGRGFGRTEDDFEEDDEW